MSFDARTLIILAESPAVSVRNVERLAEWMKLPVRARGRTEQERKRRLVLALTRSLVWERR